MLKERGPAFQRAGVLVEMPELLRELGVEPARVFDEAEIPLNSLTIDARLRFSAMLRLLHVAAERTSRADLGVLIGSRFRLSHHGVMGRLMASAPTLRDALQDFVAWQPGYSSGGIVYIGKMDDVFTVGYGIQEQATVGRRQLYDAVLTIGVRMVSQLTGGAAAPRLLCVCHSEPADAAAYRKILRAPVTFGADRTCMVLDSRSMNARGVGANAAERMAILDELRANPGFARSASSLLLRCLRPLLHAGLPSMEAVAECMGMQSRTLRRRLAAEGATFEELRDSVRYAIAQELLELTDLPVSEVGLSVAFASPNVFSEAFRRWSGSSPSQWRARSRQEKALLQACSV